MGIFNKLKKQFSQPSKPAEPKAEVQSAQDVKQPVEDLTLAELQAKEAKTSTKKVGKKKAAKAISDNSLSYKWLVKPLITEKATYLNSQSKYIFAVALAANKIEIAKAVEKLYNVKVVKVNIIRSRGKAVTYGRISGRTKRTKKAIVTLQQGQSIELYEGV